MPEDPSGLRASDTDRERVARMLREHFVQGRLDDDEFNERVESAYSARTRGELVPLMADLPERDLGHLAAASPGPPAERGNAGAVLLAPWLVWAGVNTLCLTIWLIVYLTGGSAYPWFLWVAGPWGVVLLFVTLGVVAARGGNRSRTGSAGGG